MNIYGLIEKTESFSGLSHKEQIKRMSYFYCLINNVESFTAKEIREEFLNQKLIVPSGISSLIPQLARQKPISFIKSKTGYSLHRNFKKELDLIYNNDKHEIEVSQKLRDLLSRVNSKEQRDFLDESIKCFEVKAFRAAVLMTWLLAIDVLYENILKNNLATFNNAIQLHGKYKKIVISKKDDFSDIKESDFIELLRVAKLISNDVRKILDEKLGIRNSAAHPNSIIFDELKCMSYLKDLIINVIEKYQ
ncbi:hypothetical protein HNP24_000780 [Chryseobacterium sediminis]|uniref:DUF4145 domain-containing protein n=1 Tax=Chryseobacterium sediminis TaxID=1679494 RepID=A0ABR6PVT8_9FLAO|nr:hypothetical protein [Chryseobacterium sediminis]MBB6329830.1 hypothetical protein [Chryseobacterium sediminis]